MRLVLSNGQINLVNQRSGRLLESRNADEVSQVHIIGSDAVGDRFTIDLRASETALPGGIVVHGGLDAGNAITVLGTAETDSVTVDGNELTVNGTTVEYSNLSLIRWVPGSDDDSIDVVAEGEARFVVDDGSRPERPSRPGRGGSTPPTEVFAETGELPPGDSLPSRRGRHGDPRGV